MKQKITSIFICIFQDAHLQPELQLSTSAIVAPQITKEEQAELESGDDFIHVMVTDPHKVGEGMSSFIAYNVVTRTNSNYFKKKELQVSRRFSDFLGLHDKLAEKYQQNGRIIPPAPGKSVVGMTKVKMNKEGDETQDEVTKKFS